MKPDDDHFKYVANLIKDRPNMSTNDLRYYIETCLPNFKGIHFEFVRRIKKINNYFITHGFDNKIDGQSMSMITNEKDTSYETIDMNHPLVNANLTSIFRTIMTSNNEMWKAHHFCAELNISICGFNYRIYVDPRNNELDGIVWMIPSMIFF